MIERFIKSLPTRVVQVLASVVGLHGWLGLCQVFVRALQDTSDGSS